MSCCHVPCFTDNGSAVVTRKKLELLKKRATVSNLGGMKMEDLGAAD